MLCHDFDFFAYDFWLLPYHPIYCFIMVLAMGFEPTRYFYQQILRLPRLPFRTRQHIASVERPPHQHKLNFDFMFRFTVKLVLFSTFGICFMSFSLFLTVNQNGTRVSNLRFINRIYPQTRSYRNFMCSNIAFYPVFRHFPNLRFVSVWISPVNELFAEIFSAIQH